MCPWFNWIFLQGVTTPQTKLKLSICFAFSKKKRKKERKKDRQTDRQKEISPLLKKKKQSMG